MKNLVIGLLINAFFLAACGGTPPLTQPTPASRIDNPTSTPSPLSTATRTLLPSVTPTASITPLPTIPTFTPTFDVSTIVTVTPAPRAECPNTDLDATTYQFEYELYPSGNKYVGNGTINSIMKFLNSGGNIETLIKILGDTKTNFAYQDITNDNNSDLVLVSGSLFQSLNVIYCLNGQYFLFPNDGNAVGDLFGDTVKFSMQDLNLNHIQDIFSVVMTPTGLIAKIWEWDGQSFVDLTPSDEFMGGALIKDAQLVDINGDGISEFILKGLPPRSKDFPGEPFRSETDTYYWNGNLFFPIKTFSSAQYRFQAIQDGDIQTLHGYYPEATKLYQTAIDSNELDWWSKERFEHNRESDINFTTPSVLAPDPSEYPRLAAYAYYRIMLIHLVQKHESDAGTVYNTLQQKFGSDQYGRPYAEMASAFWEAYQSTHKMYDGCAAAIQYAVEHPEILIPLGSDYTCTCARCKCHGAQSHTYVPADVCPFR